MTESISEIVYNEAKKENGTWEWAGEDHNPKVLALYADAGFPEIRNDEVPWCAAFVGATLARLGIQPSGSLLARSYSKWGDPVSSLLQAERGDVVVLPRGKAWQGHVGFLDRFTDTHVYLLGGNQGNQVNVSKYPRGKNDENIVAIRRARTQKATATESTTVRAVLSGSGATAVGGITAISQLDGNAQLIVATGLIITLLAFAWVFRERIKKFAAGVR